jgi:lipoprotein-anchoring transpeptidase ErfK/SrfK
MKLKSILIVVAALAALSAAAFLLRRPGPPPSSDARLNQPLVERATIDKAAKLRVSDQGKVVTLARQTDGTWRVGSYYDLPADFQKLSGFVGNLTEAKLQRLVTSSADRIARLEFKDTKIELLDTADKEVFTVTLGKNPETGGGRFVRFGTESKAYLASLSAWLDTESKNWANAELLNVKAEDLAKVEIPFAEGGTVTVSRAKKEDPWTSDKTPAGQQVKADKIMSVVSSVGNLRFSESTATDDAGIAVAKANLRTFKLTTFDNKTITVAMGRKPEEKKLKPPAPTTDGKTGPAALGSVADLAKKDGAGKEGEAKPADEKKPDEAKPLAPEFETIPAGPVFVFVTHSDAAATVNGLMQKRAFQMAEYSFTGLPQKSDELFEPAPPPPAPAATPTPAAAKPAEAPKKP